MIRGLGKWFLLSLALAFLFCMAYLTMGSPQGNLEGMTFVWLGTSIFAGVMVAMHPDNF